MIIDNIYAYGVSTGILFAITLCYLFFSFYHYNQKSKHAAKLFAYGGLSLVCFTLFDLATIPQELIEIRQIFPNWIFKVGLLAIPLAVFMNFQMYMHSIPVNSVSAFFVWDRYRKLYPLITSLLFMIFVLLFLIDDIRTCIIISISLILINHLFLLPITFQTLKTVPLSRSYLNTLGIIMGCFAFVLLLLITDIYQALPLNIKSSFHIIFSSLFLLYNFILTRYVMEGSLPHQEIAGSNIKDIYKNIYLAVQNNEFFIEYQPKVNLITKEVCGLEALIRWHHPEKGMIPPFEFIPMAEKTELIDYICRWVISQVAEDYKVFQKNQINLPISINFSVNNIHTETINYLCRTLALHQVPASAIIVEITESVLLDVNENIQQSLKTLHDSNIAISLDDFGAGYSSLRHISDMNLSEVKIDRALIDKLDNPKQQVIVSTILSMCHSLGIQVVAEGPNSQETIDFLISESCTIGQSYEICRPKELKDVMKWIKSGTTSSLSS